MLKPPAEREQLRFEISGFCRQLMLSRQVVTLCEQDATPRQEEFLHRVLSEEIAARERSRRARLMNRAHFPVLKSLEGYEFGCVRL